MYYRFMTRAGLFKIVQERNGRWQAMYQDEGLGSYATAQQTAEDLAGGHTFWPSCGDPSLFGIPEDITEWELVRGPR